MRPQPSPATEKHMMDTTNNTRVKVPNRLETSTYMQLDAEDEAVDPNPPGRPMADVHGGKGSKLVSCRRILNVSTLNVRTLSGNHRKQELAVNFGKHNLDLLGIQEHRIVHDETIRYDSIQGKTLITSSAWRNERGAATGGVGVLLGTRTAKALKSVRTHSSRILIINFHGNPATSILVIYSPTNISDDDVIDNFYDSLRRAIESVPTHNVLMIIGDFNARMGKLDTKHTFHETTNRNGKYLLDLICEKNLFISNFKFQKRAGKKWTYMDPAGNRCQLDYILANKKWQNSFLDTEAYSSFSSIGSDHRVVTAKVRLSLRANGKTPPRKVRYDWKLLSTDDGLQEQFTVEVRNRFNALRDEESPTENYQRFIDATNVAMEDLIPKVQKCKRSQTSSDPRVEAARTKADQAGSRYHQESNENNRYEYERAKKDLEETYNKITEEDLTYKIKIIEESHVNSQHGEAWKLINEISGRRTSQRGQIQGDTQEERIESWHRHFVGLLGSEPEAIDEDIDISPIFEDLGIKEGPFNKEEYVKAKKTLTEGKASGEDGITPEILKRCNLDDIILEFCNIALTNGNERPDQWSIINIIPIPKSGDLSLGGNYRGISLSSLVAKVYNKMLLNRIRPRLDPLLRPNQNGFRTGRTTISQILALRRMIEGIKEFNLKAVITFIDFKKAFDMVHRGMMLKILEAYGIPISLVNAISGGYKNTRARVLTPDGQTEEFQIHSGVLQGDTLAPYIFVIMLDYALRQAINGREEEIGFQLHRRQSRRKGPEVITDLDFADDIALLSEQINQAQDLLTSIETTAAQIGLEMNAKKTKVMAYNHSDEVKVMARDGTQLEVVQDFKYLGSWIDSTEKDVKIRKAEAWRALNKLNKIWKSNLSRGIKISLLSSAVESVLLYGSETWTLTENLSRQLDGCYTRMLRAALNIHWSQHLTNEQLYGSLPKISVKIRRRRLKFAGHCRRRDGEVTANLVLWTPTHGQRKQGRPALTYIDLLTKDTGIPADELSNCMRDRRVWQSITARADR